MDNLQSMCNNIQYYTSYLSAANEGNVNNECTDFKVMNHSVTQNSQDTLFTPLSGETYMLKNQMERCAIDNDINTQNEIDCDKALGEVRENKTHGRKRKRKKARLTGLSQQRQAANARERIRTKCVHAALQDLKCHIPHQFPETDQDKYSKIDILRKAAKYIEHLSRILHNHDPIAFSCPDKVKETREKEEEEDIRRQRYEDEKRRAANGRYPIRGKPQV